MDAFIHPNALCESRAIGPGTRVWAFAHILPEARIGSDCNICDGVFVENDVVIGDRTTVKCGVQLWDGVRLGNVVFVGPNATFTNDLFPRSRQRPEQYAQTIVEDGASIGANATLLPGVQVIHAGTARNAGGQLVTNGGRVLGVTALAPSLRQAADAAYAVCEQIACTSKVYRRDIGAKQLNRK